MIFGLVNAAAGALRFFSWYAKMTASGAWPVAGVAVNVSSSFGTTIATPIVRVISVVWSTSASCSVPVSFASATAGPAPWPVGTVHLGVATVAGGVVEGN